MTVRILEVAECASPPEPTDRPPDRPPQAAPRVPAGVATLIDGRQVDSASEAWRHECEARHVANLPTREARQAYLAFVRARRGQAAGQQLEQLATQIYNAERRVRT